MNNPNLGWPQPLPQQFDDDETNYWAKDKDGFDEKSTGEYAADHGSQVLNIKIEGSIANIVAAIAYIVGYSSVTPAFDPAGGLQGPYRLSRKTPARHPDYPNLRATKILSARGAANRNDTGDGKIPIGQGVSGQWKYVRLSILFEIPRYPILSDDENGLAEGVRTPLSQGGSPAPEYLRYTEWFPESNIEIQARKGETWFYPSPGANAVSPSGFAGDRLRRQPKGKLRVVTYDVAIDYVLLGRLIPATNDKRLAYVNACPFPGAAYRDQNSTGATPFSIPGTTTFNYTDGYFTSGYAQYGPGTLLMMPPKMTPRAQCHPAVLGGQISPDYFPRTMDVEQNFIIFDPPCKDMSASIDLSRYIGGSAVTPIRGHQLVPLPFPVPASFPNAGDVWTPAIKGGGKNIIAVNPLPNPGDNYLLYPYANFEDLWKPVTQSAP